MRIAKSAIAIAATGLILVAVAWAAQAYIELSRAMNRPDLRANPVTKSIIEEGAGKRWGTVYSLMPEPFAPNSSRADVEQRLMGAGFTPSGFDAFLAQFHPDLRQREVYAREANNLVCNIQLYVFVSFDEAGKLALADGMQHERGCL